MATIKDIAQMTGVSPTTVANVIHGRVGKVSKETQEKVSKVLKEVNYTAHMGGRLLAKNGSRIIGVIIQDSVAVSDHVYDNPYQGEFIQAIEQSICEEGYFMMFRRIASLEEGLKLVEMWNLEGLILSGADPNEIQEWRERISVPIVFLDVYLNGQSLPYMNIGIQDYEGGRMIGKYLIKRGHKKMAFIANGEKDGRIEGLDKVRAMGFTKALAKNQLVPKLVCVPFPRSDYHDFIRRFAVTDIGKYTALFFASDLLAIQAIAQFYKLGISVPQDISIASFDGTLLSQYSTPRLTVIKQDVLKKAEATVGLLIEAIKTGESMLRSQTLPIELVVGHSVKKLS